jgi:protein SCO1
MMNNYFLPGLLAITLLSSCGGEKKSSAGSSELPVMGRTEYVEKQVNNETVVDTVYHTIDDFEFVNQYGDTVNNESMKGQIYVADFFFTTCRTICPIMKKEMLRVYSQYGKANDFAILSHTLDPEYDTVELLHDYAQRLGVEKNTNWHFLTGDREKIYELGQDSYYVTAMEDEEAIDGIIHSGAFILVDKQQRIRGIYDGTKTNQVDVLINDIDRLMKEYNKSKAEA